MTGSSVVDERRRSTGGRGPGGLGIGDRRCLVVCLLLASCSGAPKSPARTQDPLLGKVEGMAAAPAPPAPAAPGKPPALPLPTATTATSTAALAAGPPKSIAPDGGLRIADPPMHDARSAGPVHLAGNPTAPPRTDRAAGSTALPQFTPAARPASVFGPAPVTSTTFEQLQQRLAARGVVWQRLETWGDLGEWKFSCSIPNKQNAFISRNYEGKARDPITAMRVVLDQVEQER